MASYYDAYDALKGLTYNQNQDLLFPPSFHLDKHSVNWTFCNHDKFANMFCNLDK